MRGLLRDAGRVAAVPTMLARSSPGGCLHAIGSEPHAPAYLNATIEVALNKASRDTTHILLLSLNEHMHVTIADAGTAAAIELCRHATLIQAVHVLHYLWDGLGTRPLVSHATDISSTARPSERPLPPPRPDKGLGSVMSYTPGSACPGATGC